MNKKELKQNKKRLYNFIRKIKDNEKVNGYLINNFIEKYNEVYSLNTSEADLYNTISLFKEEDFYRLGCILDIDIDHDLIFINPIVNREFEVNVKKVRKYAVGLAYKNFNRELNKESLNLVKMFLLKIFDDDLVSKYTFYKNMFQFEKIIDIEFNQMSGEKPDEELNNFMQKHTMFGGFDECLKVISKSDYDENIIKEILSSLDNMENNINIFLTKMNN
jgi:hypothetical protein